MTGIYQIRNLLNNKVYIGSAIDIKKRWASHRIELKKNKHHSNRLQNAWNKYGENNFIFEILETIESSDNLLILEQKWLDKTKCYNKKNGYNICKKADNRLGLKHSEETKTKMSQNHVDVSGKNNPFYGKSHTEEFKLNRSNLYTGRITTKETKEKHRNQNNAKGETHHFSKLTWAMVNFIRKEYSEGDISQRKLAKKYDLAVSTIKTVIKNTTWHDPNYEYKPKKKYFCNNFTRSQAKITFDIAKEIRKRYNEENVSYAHLAKEYKISIAAIAKIINNKTWKEENDEKLF